MPFEHRRIGRGLRPQWPIAVVLILCLAAGLQARTYKPGSLKARWPVKTTLASGTSVTHPREVLLSDLIALPDAPGVAAQDARYTSTRIPEAVDGLHEGDLVRTEGWVHVIAEDDDGDYHIQVTNSRTSGNRCFIVELPKDQSAFEKNAAQRARCAKLRPFLRTSLLHDAGREPSKGGNWMVGECYMSITGQLFFDDWHVGGEARGVQPGGHKGKAATLWELHPVTSIAFAAPPH